MQIQANIVSDSLSPQGRQSMSNVSKSINSLSNRRGKYSRYIWEYKRRREKYRKNLKESQLEYKRNVAQINKKIKLWNREIRRIDERHEKIKKLKEAVYIFTEHKVESKAYSKDSKEIQLARGLYYKYGLEHKMQAKELREVAGFSRIQQPTEYRRWMTMQITSSPEIKQLWENFKNHMKKS